MIKIIKYGLVANFSEKQVQINDKTYSYSSQRELTIEFPHVLHNKYALSPREVLDFMVTYFDKRGDNFVSEYDILR